MKPEFREGQNVWHRQYGWLALARRVDGDLWTATVERSSQWAVAGETLEVFEGALLVGPPVEQAGRLRPSPDEIETKSSTPRAPRAQRN
jgi:hypothetical protein